MAFANDALNGTSPACFAAGPPVALPAVEPLSPPAGSCAAWKGLGALGAFSRMYCRSAGLSFPSSILNSSPSSRSRNTLSPSIRSNLAWIR